MSLRCHHAGISGALAAPTLMARFLAAHSVTRERQMSKQESALFL